MIGTSSPSSASLAVISSQMQVEEFQVAGVETGVFDGQVVVSRRNTGKNRRSE